MKGIWKKKAADTQAKVIKAIKRLDNSKKITYEGGCEFLLNWYKEEIQSNFGERLKQLELEAKAKPRSEPCLDIEIEVEKVLNSTLKSPLEPQKLMPESQELYTQKFDSNTQEKLEDIFEGVFEIMSLGMLESLFENVFENKNFKILLRIYSRECL